MQFEEIQKPIDFPFQATSDISKNLSNYLGQYVVLYFYPKDNTPGCKNESLGFKNLYEEFKALNTPVYGISKDSLKSHESFKKKLSLPFDLISDESSVICKLFKVNKSFPINLILPLTRSTFLIDPKGCIVKSWRSVKVKGHAESVLYDLKEYIKLHK